jgi:dihydroneopterin aldolase
MITIHLHNLLFHSFHGIEEEEKISGNEFEVNAEIEFLEEASPINHLSQTINYADVFEMINKRMAIATPLLETVIMEIGNSIYKKYNFVRSINISLKKINPPIPNINGSVGVSWHKEF